MPPLFAALAVDGYGEGSTVFYLTCDLGTRAQTGPQDGSEEDIVAIFYPFSQFCEIDISLPSL